MCIQHHIYNKYNITIRSFVQTEPVCAVLKFPISLLLVVLTYILRNVNAISREGSNRNRKWIIN